MRLVTYLAPGAEAAPGFVLPDGTVIDLARALAWAGTPGPALGSLIALLQSGPDALAAVGTAAARLADAPAAQRATLAAPQGTRLLAPLPRPYNMRDFYAFEEHVRAARKLRGLDMIPEWYEIPVFYFTNPDAVIGPDDPVTAPRDSTDLDFELEIAAVIGREGRDIPAEAATDYIAGYTIMNDWSSRDIWRRWEAKLSMGPAKAKDFATTLGPWLVTPDELEDRREGTGADTRYRLEMTARVNGREYSRGNAASLTYSFAQMIAWASRDAWLRPGDVLGSGTVGTGCILELGPQNVGGWLKPGDVVELEIERLGTLRNPVVERPA